MARTRATDRPETVDAAGATWAFDRVLKEDFFSANHLYRSGDRAAVLKVSRFRFVGAFALRWLARWISRREAAIYRRLDGAPGIPRFLGTHGRDAYLHEFVPGVTLKAHVKRLRDVGRFVPIRDVPPGLFERLQATLAEIHRREVGYNDMHKGDNVIVAEDGRPWLIDFQISFAVPERGWLRLPARGILAWMVREDVYHLLKLKRRTAPHEMTAAEAAIIERRSFVNAIHKFAVRKPFHLVKRLVYPKGSNEVAWWR